MFFGVDTRGREEDEATFYLESEEASFILPNAQRVESPQIKEQKAAACNLVSRIKICPFFAFQAPFPLLPVCPCDHSMRASVPQKKQTGEHSLRPNQISLSNPIQPTLALVDQSIDSAHLSPHT